MTNERSENIKGRVSPLSRSQVSPGRSSNRNLFYLIKSSTQPIRLSPSPSPNSQVRQIISSSFPYHD
ncbi:hypothetical protein BDW67DRAFT_106828 [Aspergillus spinulosporus]